MTTFKIDNRPLGARPHPRFTLPQMRATNLAARKRPQGQSRRRLPGTGWYLSVADFTNILWPTRVVTGRLSFSASRACDCALADLPGADYGGEGRCQNAPTRE